MIIGAGYNSHITQNSKFHYHDSVRYIEGGIFDIDAIHEDTPNIPFSLHIARSPITENNDNQKKFLQQVVEITRGKDLYSIGFHLVGKRVKGIGKYGFSSHYEANKKNEERAIAFIKRVQDKFGLDVLLENTNFYSSDPLSTYKTSKSMDLICEKSNANLLIDITHSIIDHNNVNLNEYDFLGSIDWENVAEIHLAGIKEARDGSLHDGHSEEIPEKVWSLFDYLLDRRLLSDNCIVTIEHTDPLWINKYEDYLDDFNTLKSKLEKNRADTNSFFEKKSEDYAKGYLKRKIKLGVPSLEKELINSGISFDETVESWLEDRSLKGTSFCLTEGEEIFIDGARFYGKDFLDFLKESGIMEE